MSLCAVARGSVGTPIRSKMLLAGHRRTSIEASRPTSAERGSSDESSRGTRRPCRGALGGIAHGEEPLPIIDMHLHAIPADRYGPPPHRRVGWRFEACPSGTTEARLRSAGPRGIPGGAEGDRTPDLLNAIAGVIVRLGVAECCPGRDFGNLGEIEFG